MFIFVSSSVFLPIFITKNYTLFDGLFPIGVSFSFTRTFFVLTTLYEHPFSIGYFSRVRFSVTNSFVSHSHLIATARVQCVCVCCKTNVCVALLSTWLDSIWFPPQESTPFSISPSPQMIPMLMFAYIPIRFVVRFYSLFFFLPFFLFFVHVNSTVHWLAYGHALWHCLDDYAFIKGSEKNGKRTWNGVHTRNTDTHSHTLTHPFAEGKKHITQHIYIIHVDWRKPHSGLCTTPNTAHPHR